MEKIKIKHVGFDSWDREVFQTQKGTYVVDISLDYSHQNMRLCTKKTTTSSTGSRTRPSKPTHSRSSMISIPSNNRKP